MIGTARWRAGEHDIQLPPKHAEQYAALFGNAELAVVPGAGHFPWLGDPGWFAGRLARW
ncbi:alpha/beta fold hydrolase [Dactylosporangium sp. CA-233914]|uniref:alpha/beta fold hydrolase n=1 Tax=Dactylosporangium sp. CA-233914 TaxID=3239934 RepID=UPI003D90D7EE